MSLDDFLNYLPLFAFVGNGIVLICTAVWVIAKNQTSNALLIQSLKHLEQTLTDMKEEQKEFKDVIEEKHSILAGEVKETRERVIAVEAIVKKGAM